MANRGNATSRASTTRFFLGNVAIGARHVPALKKGKTSPGSVSVVVPAGTANGAYPVRACADASKNVTESNERNNCRVANGRVAVLAPVKPPPPPPPTVLDSDGDGSLDNVDCAPHDPSIHPGAPDKPDLKFVDSNCDGIDGTAAKAIFVSPLGDDAAAGTMAQPKRTIAAAVAAAQGKDVYATFGIYTEALNIVSGVSVYGGYDVSWKRSLAQATRITGATTASGDTVGAVAVNIAAPTTLQLVTLAPSAPTSSGRSSYGLRGIGSRGLLIEHVSILAAPGAPGAGGSNGVSGKSGGDGIGGGVGDPLPPAAPGRVLLGTPEATAGSAGPVSGPARTGSLESRKWRMCTAGWAVLAARAAELPAVTPATVGAGTTVTRGCFGATEPAERSSTSRPAPGSGSARHSVSPGGLAQTATAEAVAAAGLARAASASSATMAVGAAAGAAAAKAEEAEAAAAVGERRSESSSRTR